MASFLAGAAGGALMSFLIVASLKILVLTPGDGVREQDRIEARIDGLEGRIQRLELNSGQLDPHDAARAGAPQRGALD